MTKAAIYLAGFYMVYTFLLSRDTWYSRNRTFILLSVLSSLILPFITIQTNKPIEVPVFGKVLSEVFVTGLKAGNGLAGSGNKELTGLQILNSVYLAGIIFFGSKLLIDFFELIFLIIRKRNRGTHIIRFHGFNTAGFSALGQVFINSRLTPEEAEEIIRHEQNHLDHNHFLDIVFIEIVKVLQWFNPIIHMLDRSLRAVHEYQADEGCLKTGIPVVNYQRLLLNQVFSSKIFGLTNCFSNPTLIKKRMIMMTKKRTSALANMKLLIVAPVIGFVFLAISAYKDIPDTIVKQTVPITVPEVSSTILSTEVSKISSEPAKLSSKPATPKKPVTKSETVPPPSPPPVPASLESTTDISVVKEQTNEESNVSPFVVVEQMPMFPGGDTELLKYIATNTNYPESAKINNIAGRVIIRFCVTEKGGVRLVSVLKGVSPELDAEAIRVVKTLPSFIPGSQGGKAVPVWYMVPITFSLK